MKTINISEAKSYFDVAMTQSLHEPITVTDEQKEILACKVQEWKELEGVEKSEQYEQWDEREKQLLQERRAYRKQCKQHK